MTEVPTEIIELVEQFQRNIKAYKNPSYKEEQLKQEFINPFFKALGWDVDNTSRAAPQYKDVIFEDSIKVAGGTKAPDYCFTLTGRKMFFVEAKKPSVNIDKDIPSSYQLRRYAWSAKLPLSILTDFEELAVYDTRSRPKKTDRSSAGRIKILKFTEYIENWDYLYNHFSKDAVLKGSFDKYAESTKKKRGTTEVDQEFLSEIENWRQLFAKNIALRNPNLTVEELNFAVQQTIDRIIFLRMCEDRGIEKYGQLRSLINEKEIYQKFGDICREADAKYNSGLFHFQEEKGRPSTPDELTLGLNIDDGVFKVVFKSLYYPESPYEFSVLQPEILGNVYEQFLGKVIRLTSGHRAKIEEKPEVKKAGGVFYTPQYIVDYIVENTVGKLCRGKTPNKVSELKILDPACGSGSFLLGAYKYLLQWHRDYYSSQKDKKRLKDKIYKGKNGEWFLTIQEKKRILLNNIYGVDIDSQAVWVTKLSLLLKVLEGENKDVLEAQQKLYKERALPDLDSNIKCGNSLIGPEIYNDSDLELTGNDIKRINPFDWESEFPDIFVDGGFDAVIGNPPYIRIQRIGHIESDYIYQHYNTPTSKTDISLIFLERSLSLSQKNGKIGFISTSQWLSTDYGKKMRCLLADGKLHEIVDFGSLPVFSKASTYPAIFLLSPSTKRTLGIKRIRKKTQLNLNDIDKADVEQIQLSTLSDDPWNLGDLDIPTWLKNRGIPFEHLKSFGKAYYSVVTGLDKVFIVDKNTIEEKGLETEIIFPYAYKGAEVFRYTEINPQNYVIYPYTEKNGSPKLIPESDLKINYPNIHQYFHSFKDDLRKRKDSRKYYASGSDWFRHVRPGSFFHIKSKKLLMKGISKKVVVGVLKENTAFSGANCPGIIFDELKGHSILYFLGIMNSKVITYHLKMVCPSKLSGYTRFNANNINKTPIRSINFANTEDVARHDRMVTLVEQMLQLHKDRNSAKTPQDKELIKRQIEATDKQIDSLVYDLYGLTKKEIEIIEKTV